MAETASLILSAVGVTFAFTALILAIVQPVMSLQQKM